MQPFGGTGAGRFFARHGTARLNLPAALAALLFLLTAPLAHGQTDDFNDGNDNGWSRYAPLDPAPGPDASFTFPDGGYRIVAQPSPSAPTLGPGRAGSFRQDAAYSRFYAAVDLVNWDNTKDQAFGLLARVTTPGAGTTNGYAFTYSNQPPSLDISRVTGEVPTGVIDGDLALDPAQDYRFVFEGDGTTLIGSVYFMGDLVTPLVRITGDDATYASGVTGLVVFDNTSAENAQVGADATFDNYVAGVVPEPGGVAALLGLLAMALRVRRRR
jgi:hypothetical protein